MHRPCSKRRASTVHDTPGSPDSRIPAEGIRTVLISDCAVTSATFIEDADRRAVSGTLASLEGDGDAD
jgi:hypothetical protein